MYSAIVINIVKHIIKLISKEIDNVHCDCYVYSETYHPSLGILIAIILKSNNSILKSKFNVESEECLGPGGLSLGCSHSKYR